MFLRALAGMLVLTTATSLSLEVCNDPCTLISIAEDGSYSVSIVAENGRPTPPISANIVDGAVLDIDGDSRPELVVIDDRESAFGPVTAVFYDVSTNEPYIAFQCPASNVEAVEEECSQLFDSLSPELASTALDHVYATTRSEGELGWDVRHVLIPNASTRAAMTLAVQNVELARARLELNESSDEALSALHAALLFREQRALRFWLAD
tara:strand:- start:1018 stop:1644 length:627 start_codon:yes stop_codon:yes gene_type:complete